MVYDRNRRNRDGEMDYGRDYGSGRNYSQSSGREYAAGGWNDRGDNGRFDSDRDENRGSFGGGSYGSSAGGSYGSGNYGGSRGYGERSGGYGRGDMDRGGYGDSDFGRGSYGQGGYGQGGYGQSGSSYGRGDYGRGDYGRDGGSPYGRNEDRYGSGNYGRSSYGQAGQRSYGQNQGGGRDRDYDYDDRGFFARAGDEVRSWFGDDDAERRRNLDQRYDQQYSSDSDRQYGAWRSGQIAALDRDYDEYRQENQSKFHNEFGSWRSERQTQRSSLDKVTEHMEVVGSDGQHVGTVDKVRGDKIILTKTDQDAGGHHHSIPSRWIQSVDDKVTIRKTAEEAKKEWTDVERKGAMFGDDTGSSSASTSAYGTGSSASSTSPRALNRSFSGTYDKDS